MPFAARLFFHAEGRAKREPLSFIFADARRRFVAYTPTPASVDDD